MNLEKNTELKNSLIKDSTFSHMENPFSYLSICITN